MFTYSFTMLSVFSCITLIYSIINVIIPGNRTVSTSSLSSSPSSSSSSNNNDDRHHAHIILPYYGKMTSYYFFVSIPYLYLASFCVHIFLPLESYLFSAIITLITTILCVSIINKLASRILILYAIIVLLQSIYGLIEYIINSYMKSSSQQQHQQDTTTSTTNYSLLTTLSHLPFVFLACLIIFSFTIPFLGVAGLIMYAKTMADILTGTFEIEI
eukprot:TRINITY_DN3855_c1_g1_i1.p1 TRINITY_DN3855_c1_g1~~TRINITY_DN3855_c1_g1_i1.p1  ORF type:complete len:215 (+),score=48.47 TRINITY_DN3855_c1_g1_i1:404-1048(+)